MTRKTRKILFILAIVAFAAIGSIVIAYAQGYRWDFENKKFLLSGGLYIKTLNTEDAKVLINEKDKSNHTASLIKNLLPLRTYKIRVAQDGYQNWVKELEIKPGLVTEAENIVLFPEKLSTEKAWPETDVKNLSVSPDLKFAAVLFESSKFVIKNPSEPNAAAPPLVFSDKRKTNSIGFLKSGRGWPPSSKKFLFSRAVPASGRLKARTFWYIWENETNQLTDLTALYERKIVLKQPSASPLPTLFEPVKLTWFAGDNDVIALMSGKLFRIDIKNESITDLNLSDIADFDSWENKIAALKKPDILMFMDSAIENVSVLGQTKFAPKRLLFSRDGSKIAYADENNMGVFWLKETAKQPLRKSGDQETIYQTNSSISEIFWHHYSEHLVFLENNRLGAVELDTRSKTNTASWFEDVSGIDYAPVESKLFILAEGIVKPVEGKF